MGYLNLWSLELWTQINSFFKKKNFTQSVVLCYYQPPWTETNAEEQKLCSKSLLFFIKRQSSATFSPGRHPSSIHSFILLRYGHLITYLFHHPLPLIWLFTCSFIHFFLVYWVSYLGSHPSLPHLLRNTLTHTSIKHLLGKALLGRQRGLSFYGTGLKAPLDLGSLSLCPVLLRISGVVEWKHCSQRLLAEW